MGSDRCAGREDQSADVGAVLFHRSQLVEVSGGLWYWHNEYGKPSSDPGAGQATPFVGLAFHLDGGRAALVMGQTCGQSTRLEFVHSPSRPATPATKACRRGPWESREDGARDMRVIGRRDE